MIAPKNIAVIQPNNLGDVIMAVPVVCGLKQKFRNDIKITYFVEDGFEAGLINNPDCDNIFKFKRKEIRNQLQSDYWQNGYQNLRECISELKRDAFDVVYNFSQLSYTSYFTTVIGTEKKYGRVYLHEGNESLNDLWSQYLYCIPFARTFNKFHTTDIYRHIAEVEKTNIRPYLFLSDQEIENSAKYLYGKGISPEDRKLMIFQPGAALASKRWPIEHFIELANKLIQTGWKVLITGAESERSIADCICNNVPNGSCIISAGETTFREAICLLKHVKGCVTGDTAMMHAAAALQIPIYALFGPTNPVETGPYSSGNFIFSGRCANRPCFCKECKTHLCMRSIMPDDVFACINNQMPDKPNCDIYQTYLSKTGEYELKKLVENGNPYFDETGSAVIREFFENSGALQVNNKSDVIKTELKMLIDTVSAMSHSLESYLIDYNADHIKQFESTRMSLSECKDIGTFFSAYINIRLNSIPLLDPLKGLKETIRSCKETSESLDRLVAKL